MRTSLARADNWRREERRMEPRYTMILRVGVLEQRGKSSLCLVKNISTQGVQVKFYTAVVPGAPVSIRIADEPVIQGKLKWVEGEIAGIQFDEELDAATLLRVQQKLKQNKRRSMPRVDIAELATLRSGGRTCRAHVCDISSIGARIRVRGPLSTGDRAIVTLAGLPAINAFVRWNEGEESGLAFETPIPMQILASWIDGRVHLSA